ncbi:MAG: WecB/TagA/CpsF family glycosyltransferase [Sodaliphilus sp.]|nr:WecB/TagA/CpsF family glycosyltransferase [Sodaliphilus sp.]
MKQVMLNGVGVYPFRSDKEILDFVSKQNGVLVAINALKILNATDETRQLINRNIGYCDGVGAQLALRKKGEKDVVKIPGCELWLKIVAAFYKQKTFYLIGGKQTVIEKCVAKLKEDFPGINIVGYRNGYLKDEGDKQSLIADIVSKKPDVVFVAMGSPKQELLMEEIQKAHNAIFQGLGGSFDVYVGAVERAPKWWLDHNLEFAYRLIRQPKRIKSQILLFKFLWKLYTDQL